MIELAPENKRGLSIAGPLMLAAGGYGAEYERETLNLVHALVTHPTSLRARVPASRAPRVISFPGGALVDPESNPGLAAVLSSQRHFWTRMGIPLILSLAGFDVRNWVEIARRVRRIPVLAALELAIEEGIDATQAIAQVRGESDLPILARIPINGTLEIADGALKGGADALTVGLGPLGRAGGEKDWEGRLVGPALRPMALHAVYETAKRFPTTPLVGAGGVGSSADVRAFLSAGALAVQIDTILWRDPRGVLAIAAGL